MKTVGENTFLLHTISNNMFFFRSIVWLNFVWLEYEALG